MPDPRLAVGAAAGAWWYVLVVAAQQLVVSKGRRCGGCGRYLLRWRGAHPG